LDLNFPRMKEKYIQTYGNQYEINSPNSSALLKLFHQKCTQHGIIHDNRKLFEYLNTFEEKQSDKQLSLFD
ncbi:MAG: radical SAM protein, partial [Clostridia bacterium]